jgi:hypothetical protein
MTPESRAPTTNTPSRPHRSRSHCAGSMLAIAISETLRRPKRDGVPTLEFATHQRQPKTNDEFPYLPGPMWLRSWTASQASAYVLPHARSPTKHRDSSPKCDGGQHGFTCSFQTWVAANPHPRLDSIPS